MSVGEQAGALTQGTIRAVGDVITAPIRVIDPQDGLIEPRSQGLRD
jgi:hypothetical protein